MAIRKPLVIKDGTIEQLQAADRVVVGLGIESLTNPGVDRIFFWDNSSSAAGWLQAGTGLTISETTFNLDINSLNVATIAAGDFIPFWDITVTATNKKITFANFEGTLAHGNLSGYVANEHIDWTNATNNLLTAGTGKFVLSATDVMGLYIDGTTNPFTTSGAISHSMRFTRTFNQDTGNIADAVGIRADIILSHTNAKLVATKELRAYLSYITNNGTVTNETGSGYYWHLYGIDTYLNDNGTYDTTSTGAIYPYWYGTRSFFTMAPTFTDSGGNAGDAYNMIFGNVVRISSLPTLSSGTLKQYLYGSHIRVEGNTEGSSYAYGVYIYRVQDCDTNWAIYDLSGANWALREDNQKIFFGVSGDASIYYDEVNFVINPKEIGTGYLDVKGGITADGTIAGITITGANVTSGVDPGHTHGGAAGGGWSPTAVTVNIDGPQTIPHNTTTVIEFDQEEYDPGSCFNTGTYRYTVPLTGYYLITASAYMLSCTVGGRAHIIARNAAGILCQGFANKISPAGHINPRISKIVYLEAAGYVEFAVLHMDGVNRVLSDTDYITHASIMRLA